MTRRTGYSLSFGLALGLSVAAACGVSLTPVGQNVAEPSSSGNPPSLSPEAPAVPSSNPGSSPTSPSSGGGGGGGGAGNASASPEITSTTPGENEVVFSLSQTISVTFSLDMDETTLDASTFIVTTSTDDVVDGTVTLDDTKKIATFTPATPLLSGETYQIKIDKAVKSSSGTMLSSDFIWTFEIDESTSLSVDFEESSYVAGSIGGQDDWSDAINGTYDQDVSTLASGLGFSTFGALSFRMSNAVTSGSFSDWVYAKPLPDAAGEADATAGSFDEGTRKSHFEAQFDFASAQPSAQQSGLAIAISPDRGDGSRMSFLRLKDTAGGLAIDFTEVQGESDATISFPSTSIATGLDRTVPHTVKISLDLVDGPSNDVVKVYVDGALVHTGTSWENYYRFDNEASGEQSTRVVRTLLFRASGSASPANLGKGFLFDNLTLTSGPSS